MTSLQGKRTVIAALVTACTVVVTAGAFMSLFNKNPPFAIATQVTQEEPATTAGSSVPVLPTGCWDVAITNDTALSATWVPACDDAAPATLGEQPWPQGVVSLRALGTGEPPMSWAQSHAEMSQELAQHGTGALLYLPANSDGSGYYVAAWSLVPSAGDDASGADLVVKRGLTVGVYGAPPTSVVTPAGRVYFNADLSPRKWSEARHESADTDDDDEDDTSDADTQAASGSADPDSDN